MKPGPQFDTLFHGTNKELETGDKVLPPNVAKAGTPNSSHVGVAHREGTPHDPYVNASASGNERTAWEFAGMSSMKQGGRAAVYKVDRPDDAIRGLEPKEVLSKQGFPVTGREDIRPPETVRAKGPNMRYVPNPNGRQGTLPIDWMPSGTTARGGFWGATHGDPWNHPTERERMRPAKQAATLESMAPKKPPMYLGGYKVDDSVSEAHQQDRGGMSQPMLPGMRGAVKRQPKRR